MPLHPHLNSINYPKQRMMIVEIDQYVWLVLYFENEEEVFLKKMTIGLDLKK